MHHAPEISQLNIVKQIHVYIYILYIYTLFDDVYMRNYIYIYVHMYMHMYVYDVYQLVLPIE